MQSKLKTEPPHHTTRRTKPNRIRTAALAMALGMTSFALAESGEPYAGMLEGLRSEITAKLLRYRYCIHEVPISYAPRTFSEGKKISWSDGVVAIWTLLRFRWMRRKKRD